MADRKLKLDLVVKDNGSVEVGKFADKAKRKLEEVERRSARLGDSMLKVGKWATVGLAAAATAAAATAAAMYGLTKRAADAGDRFQDMKDRVGVSTEALSAWAHAAGLSGTNMDELEVGWRILAKNMSEAAKGMKGQVDLFKDLGVVVTDTDGRLRPLDQITLDIADKLAGMTDQTKAAALAQEIFGRSGTNLLPLLKGGSDGIKALTDEARALGLVWSDEDSAAASEFNDALDRMNNAVSGVGQTLGKAMLPAMTAFVNVGLAAAKMAVEWAEANKELINEELTAFLKNTLPVAVKVIGALGSVIGTTIQAVHGFADAWRDAGETFDAIVSTLNNELDAAVRSIGTTFGKMRDGVKTIITNMMDIVYNQTVGRLMTLAGKVKEQLSKISGAFEWLADAVAFHSFVPDMLDVIEKEFGSLDGRMVKPAQEAAAATAAAFEQLNNSTSKGGGGSVPKAVSNEARAVLEQFEMAWTEAVRGQTEASRLALKRQYDEYAKHVGDKVKLDEWYNAELNHLTKGQVEGFDKHVRNLADSAGGLGEAFKSGFGYAKDAIIDFTRTGKFEFASFADSILNDMMRLGLDALGGLLGSWFGGGFSGASGSATLGGGVGKLWHSGGMVGPGSGGPSKWLPASAWAKAPRLHNGLAADEFPAVLQTGERVIPRGGSEPKVEVHIHPPAGYKANVTEGRTSNGGQRLDVMIEEVVAGKIGGGGKIGRAIETRYGVRPTMGGH